MASAATSSVSRVRATGPDAGPSAHGWRGASAGGVGGRTEERLFRILRITGGPGEAGEALSCLVPCMVSGRSHGLQEYEIWEIMPKYFLSVPVSSMLGPSARGDTVRL